MGMTKSEKKIRTGSKSKNVQASVVQFPIKWETEPMPAPIEDKETPVTEDAPADTTEPKDAEDAPMEEESAPVVEEKAAEERGEETEQPVAMEPVEEQTAPVEEEQSVSEEREQPEEQSVMNTGFLCGCV